MSARNRGDEGYEQANTTRDRSFDSLAKELATGNVSRTHMLKWMGKALFGAALFSIPGVAWAAQPTGRGRAPTGAQGCPQAGQSNCRGSCVFLDNDTQNCGSCGNVCGAGYSCIGGTCACPDPGQENCQGTCVSLSSDSNNCGSCGNVCTGEKVCRNGTCVCDEGLGQSDCDGVCVDLLRDPNNCGSCGNVCPPGMPCYFSDQGGIRCQCPPESTPTSPPSTYCPEQQACRFLMSDPNNCGGCGNVCPPGTVCLFGECRSDS